VNRRVLRAFAAVAVVLALGLAACSSDDGADVRSSGSGSGSGGSGSAGSSSGSGSGLSEEEISGTSDNPLVQQAVKDYEAYVTAEIDQLITDTTVFTDAVRAGDLEAAKAAYAPSRVSWERIEPIAGLVEAIDGAVDARVDDFENEHDPAFTGWHRIEYILWEQNTTDGAAEFADQLDEDLATLKSDIADVEITPLAVTQGSAELIEEVSEGKITGEEDRYSHTDLWDLTANVEGSAKAFELMKPAVEEADPALAADIESDFSDIDAALAEYEEGDGYKSYEELTEADKDEMKAILASLSENLAKVPGVLQLG
jgi:iron uptake system component EfeO